VVDAGDGAQPDGHAIASLATTQVAALSSTQIAALTTEAIGRETGREAKDARTVAACGRWRATGSKTSTLDHASPPDSGAQLRQSHLRQAFAYTLNSCCCLKKNGAPEEIRTPDPQIRSLVLYPAELRVRGTAVITACVAIL
jgi:hypothetical protein